jgi:hypothetical protein
MDANFNNLNTDKAELSALAATTGSALIGADDDASGTLWTAVQGALTYIGGKIATLISSAGSSIVGYIQAGTGAVAGTAQAKLRLLVDVKIDFGALGDGATSDQTAFDNATLLGVPVYVPATASFYVLTTLSAAQKELLYGPGVVKVAGAFVSIPAIPQSNNTSLPTLAIIKAVLTPTNNTSNGSVGLGPINTTVTRSGGYGQYGNWLSQYLVTDATPAAEFDVGITSWLTHTNLTGGSAFGGWDGVNTPSKALGQTYSGGAAIGREVNVGNRWGNFGLQTDVGGTRYTVGEQLVPDVLPALDGLDTTAVTISVASPAVVSWTGHGLIANMGIVFSGTGIIPTGITAGTTYYVSATALNANDFQISATIGGASINTSGSFVAPVLALPSWAGSFAQFIGQSVHGHQWWVGTLIRSDSLVAGGYGHIANGGSVAGNAPLKWAGITGYWDRGLDFEGATFSGACINFDFTNGTAATATAGGVASPGNFQAFLKVSVGGTVVKVPYFNN